MPKPILHVDEIELQAWPAGQSLPPAAADRYGAETGAISARLGAQKLGYQLTVVPPGKAAYPAHNHRVNEEMFFVLAGQGTLRIGDQRYPVGAGDFIACPPGGADSAHQLVNTGTVELRYLAVSTKLSPELVDYPDSGKFGVLLELPAESDGSPFRFVHVGRSGDSRPYWEGE